MAALLSAASLLSPALGEAQWSLTRMNDMTMSTSMGMRGMRGMRATMTTMTTETAEPQGDASARRTEVLIGRYRTILSRDPRESFAFQRLMDLYRERDGNVDGLVRDLEQQVQGSDQAFAPRMLLGHVYKAQNRTRDAVRLYSEASQLRPNDPVPLIAMGNLQRADDPARARELFEQALTHLRDAQEKRELLRELGALALDARDWDGARAYYDQLAQGAGTSVYLRSELARALSERNQHERAIAEYERVLGQLRGDNRVIGPILRDLARAQLEAGQMEDAIATLDRALRVVGRQSGVRSEVYDVMVEVYRRADRLPDLAERLARARDFDAVHLLGKIHDELGDEDEALAAYRRALRMNRRHIDTRVMIIRLLSRSGRIDDVITEYRELVRVAPREPRFVVELAQLLMQVGRREEALRLADQTSRRHGRDAGVHQALADLYTRWGEDERATREVAMLVRIDPRDPGHLIALGEQQLEEGDSEAALATWRRILTVDSDRARANATLAGVLADHDMLDEAERHYRRAVELDEDRVEYLRGLAAVLERPRRGERPPERRQRDEAAAEYWAKVLETGVDRAERREARQRIVGIWSRRGELNQKITEWQGAFTADPPDAEAGRFLAEAYLRMRPRNVERAETTLVRITELEPGDVESLLSLERVRAARGELAGAIEVLQRLVDADPRRAPRYLQRMAEHSHALYRDEDAVRYAAEAVSRTPDDAEGHRRLGDLYRARQDMDDAIASYRRAIELNDRLFTTYFDLAEIHLARGEHTEADRLYRGVLRLSPDDDLVARAGRASVQIHLGANTLEELERDLLPLALGNPRRPIFRRLLVELYDSLAMGWIQEARGTGEAAVAARESLDRLGVRAIKPLLEALADGDPTQQRIAIDVLGHLGNENAAGPLLAAAEGDGPLALRVRALAGAGAVAEPRLASRFVSIADGPERRLRAVATWSLARMGGNVALSALRELGSEGDPDVRAYAALGMGRAGDRRSVEELERLLREDRSAHVQAAAAWSLGKVGTRAQIPALVSALRRGGLVSRAAAQSLGALGRGGDDRALDALVEALFDPDSTLHTASAAALANPEGTEDRPFTVPAGDAAAYVGGLLETSGSHPVDLTPILGRVESAAREALHGPVERVLTALTLLRPVGDLPIGIGALTANIGSWPEEARNTARARLQRLGASLAADLQSLSRHPEPQVREHAVLLVARAADPSVAGEALVTALSDANERVVRAALSAVGPEHRDVEGLIDRTAHLSRQSDEWSTRLRAVQSLARLGDPAGVEPLIQILREDRYAFVREGAATALGALGGPRALEALGTASEDPEPRVRAAAQRALQR